MAKVVIRVSPKGEVTVEGEGILGTSCTTHTQPFVQALGRVKETTPKTEMFEESRTESSQEIQQ
jgi:hypothetical protein